MKEYKTIVTITYGTRIKKFRELKKLSQFELEAKAKLAFGSISRIENGNVNPTKESLFKIAYALQLTKQEVIELFGI